MKKTIIVGTVALLLGTTWIGSSILERGKNASQMMAEVIIQQDEGIKELDKQIILLQTSLRDANERLGYLQAQNGDLQSEVEALEEHINTLEERISIVSNEKEQLEGEVIRLNTELNKANQDAINFENDMLNIINSLPEPHRSNILKKIYKKS
jgi:chromosome segregation ATPase